MRIVVDIETAGLDAQKFLMACLWIEGRKKPEFYKTKNKLWKRIKDLGRAESKRNKILSVYSHYAQYDTAGYIDLNEEGLKFISNYPFIWTWSEGNKEMIKFLDSMGIFSFSLKKLGEMIGLPKKEMPKELINENTIMNEELYEKIMTNDRDWETILNLVVEYQTTN